MTEQKGVQLLLENRAWIEANNVKVIVLGSGERPLEEGMLELMEALPNKVFFRKVLDEKFSHLVEAGSDFFVMPSLFEPCGLNQMYSQVYGTIPIVTRVGGLLDTVVDIDENPADGTGILVEPSAGDLLVGLQRALALFGDSARYVAVQRRGMERDFGWESASRAYDAFYEELLG